MNKDKIVIIGSAHIGLTELAAKLNLQVEFVSVEKAKEITSQFVPEPIQLIPPLIMERPFNAPLTRAQRRKQQRKKP